MGPEHMFVKSKNNIAVQHTLFNQTAEAVQLTNPDKGYQYTPLSIRPEVNVMFVVFVLLQLFLNFLFDSFLNSSAGS